MYTCQLKLEDVKGSVTVVTCLCVSTFGVAIRKDTSISHTVYQPNISTEYNMQKNSQPHHALRMFINSGPF